MPGEIRTYDITKRERVLEGDTVNYLNWEDLRRALDWDIEQEKKFSYQGLSEDERIEHIAKFISGIWQIHAFREGNTRTTAVFAIQYLRSLGFRVDNRMFALHSWYFRNALVRANYRNIQKDIDYTPIYLVRFFRNLLLGEKWDLKNRYLHINATKEWGSQPCLETSVGGVNGHDGGVNNGSGGVNGGVITESLLLKTITDNPGLNAPALSKQLHKSLRTVQRYLKSLSDMGKIEFRGAPKTGGYWPKSEEQS